MAKHCNKALSAETYENLPYLEKYQVHLNFNYWFEEEFNYNYV